ncbi:MAG: hypothetical protein IPJ40_08705 [Saprospirales bacterium]|nr:hypothetical protein [Saprospirales bacterium]
MYVEIRLAEPQFQKAFNSFNTFQAMAPIGKYIEGKFSSTMIMDSELGPDMMPVWSTMSANGFLQTINSVIKGFPALQAVGDKLNISEFDNLAISNTKNWFEVKDGALELKDFDYAYKGIDMKIGGMHKINQDMAYHILAKIPRKMLEKGAVGAAAGSGLNALSQEAGKLGINLAQSEFVNVQFNITGSITNPQVTMKLLGGDGRAPSPNPSRNKPSKNLNNKRQGSDRSQATDRHPEEAGPGYGESGDQGNHAGSQGQSQGSDPGPIEEDPGADQERIGGF